MPIFTGASIHWPKKLLRLLKQPGMRLRQFISAPSREEIIFTRGTTESINLVAYTWGRQNIKEGDEIIISTMEHHSNIVPWQILCEEKNAVLKVIPVNDDGELMLDEYQKLLSPKTKLVAVVHASNALGTVNPVKKMINLAHQAGAIVLIDGAQSTVHTGNRCAGDGL